MLKAKHDYEKTSQMQGTIKMNKKYGTIKI